MIIKNFNDNYYLVGLSITKNDKGEERYGFNFLFNNRNIEGYGAMKISCEKSKVEKMLGGVPEVGCVYSVYTDKFLTPDKQLITYLKDLVKDKTFTEM